MKLYFMKQSALDFLKANIGKYYTNYLRFTTNEWIMDLFDYDPFVEFATIPDFDLADLSLQPGEIDFQNCKILYEHLSNISESQASDERLWAGLCNNTFYSYLRERFQLAKVHLRKASDDSETVLSRFFYKNGGRSGLFRNTLSRCWWTGRLTYSPDLSNHWELLDAIGSEDIISKMSDIFYSNNYSSNFEITRGFCQGLKVFRDRGIKVDNRNHIRPTAQYLNAIGGSTLLDFYSSSEIKKMVVEHIGLLMNNQDIGLLVDTDEIEEEPEEQLNNTTASEVNVDFEEYLDSLETVDSIDLDQVFGKISKVEYGCTVFIEDSSKKRILKMPIPTAEKAQPFLAKFAIGKSIDDHFKVGTIDYKIVNIVRD